MSDRIETITWSCEREMQEALADAAKIVSKRVFTPTSKQFSVSKPRIVHATYLSWYQDDTKHGFTCKDLLGSWMGCHVVLVAKNKPVYQTAHPLF